MFDVTQAGADPTGNHDSSHAIQLAIENHPGEAIYFPHGIYKLARMLTLRPGTQLFGHKDAVIKADGSLQTGMLWTHPAGIAGITIRGLIFDQSDQDVPPQRQVWDILTLNGTSDVVIHDCTFTGGEKFGGDSHIMVGDSRNVRITDCLFHNASDEGVYVSGKQSFGIIIARNNFIGCGNSDRQVGGGYCIGIKRGAQNTIVEGNTFDSARFGIYHESGDSGGTPGSHSIITGNVFRDISLASVQLVKSDCSIVNNNRFDGNGLNVNRASVDVDGSSYCTLVGNVFQLPKQNSVGIRFYKTEDQICRSNVVSGNVFVGPGTWIDERDGTTGNIIRYTPEQVTKSPVELNIRA